MVRAAFFRTGENMGIKLKMEHQECFQILYHQQPWACRRVPVVPNGYRSNWVATWDLNELLKVSHKWWTPPSDALARARHWKARLAPRLGWDYQCCWTEGEELLRTTVEQSTYFSSRVSSSSQGAEEERQLFCWQNFLHLSNRNCSRLQILACSLARLRG